MATLDSEQLKIKLRTIKSRLTKFKSYFDNIDKENVEDNVLTQLRLRFDKNVSLLDEFNDVIIQIEVIDESDDTDKYDREIETFENSYYDLIGNIQCFLDSFVAVNNQGGGAASTRSSTSSNHNHNIHNSVTLPPIKIPTFSGNYENWLEFKDTFTVLVDQNESLADIQKFYYLKSSVEKDAKEVIKAIEVSSENYQVAWKLLLERFENKKLITHNHLKSIFDHPVVLKESHTELRNLYDNITKHLRALKSLGEKTDEWDRLIIYIICSKFDNTTRRDWESHKYESELPTMKDLNNFLKTKCDILEKLEVTKVEKSKVNPSNSTNTMKNTLKKYNLSSNHAAVVGDNKLSCYFCKQNHGIYHCESFLKLNINDRIKTVKDLNLCINCLNVNHLVRQCKSRTCSKCNKPHNTLLHIDKISKNDSAISTVDTNPSISTEADGSSISTHTYNQVALAISKNVQHQVLLSTVLIKIKNRNNQYVTCRALLDNGSQSNFITENLCKKLNLSLTRISHVIKGVGQSLSSIANQVNVEFKSFDEHNFAMNINCLVIPNITDKLPTISFDKGVLNIPSELKHADPTFNILSDIDVLLNSEVFWRILCNDTIKLGQITLQNTKLGWIVGGSVNLSVSQCKTTINLNVVCQDQISSNLERFWELEAVNNKRALTPSEQYCEELFIQTTKRNQNGRFIVEIPFKESIQNLGNSRDIALNRFYTIEKRLSRNPELKQEYTRFMTEYKQLGHMQEINETSIDSNSVVCYLPHHAVIKANSLTTKCRVVFDASAKTDSGLSLNDVQLVGPKLQQDIFSILLRFRKYKFVITADISKMYRQVLITEDQRQFQRIFWRANTEDELQCYQLNTVTYGTASAPYLAVRCLLQLGVENKNNFPLASKVITNDFYVDDLLTGADSVDDILKIQREISDILLSGGFELCKWLCNDRSLSQNFKINSENKYGILNIGEDESSKTLGIYWDSNNDFIKYAVNITQGKKITKRSVLSCVCQIYDPLGLVVPVITTAKLFIQKLWSLEVSWDEVLPQTLQTKWVNFQNELLYLNDLKIPRHATISEYVAIELHGFCDSSERAYGACLYLRCITTSSITSNLICAKSRVAPLKTISLPRLELCGALLLANLVKKSKDSLAIQFHKTVLWSDSTITLAWIKGDPSRWKTFVSNRVSEIQTLTNISDWHHIASSDNPADLLSRGTSPRLLSNCKLWWHGPKFLETNDFNYHFPQVKLDQNIPEQRTVSNISTTTQLNDIVNPLLQNISNIVKIQRILAFIMRFVTNTQLPKGNRKTGVLTPNELNNSLIFIVKIVQQQSFSKEYEHLVRKVNLPKNSKILPLNPFLQDGLIRVGGRIRNAEVPYDQRHPIILPKDNILTRLILQREHEKLLHCGPTMLLCSIRDRFWPLSGRNLCKAIVKRCVKCFKAKPITSDYLMGDLPDVRVNMCSPFMNVGIDYGGPLNIKENTGRKSKLIKVYICLFVCMCTKAVHLELVHELTTEAFLSTLKRFVARRGKPTNIYSDNGLNFVGASNELKAVSEFLSTNTDYIANALVNDNIKWHFIPARSPTFGGLWEAGIKSSKALLKRVVGNNLLTYDELYTILIQIEAILNSRPLSPLTNDPDNISALTPSHFLIGRKLTALPELHVLDIPENRLSRFQRLQHVIQQYWSRWQREYLSEHQVRTKWKFHHQQLLKEGTMVLVKMDNCPPLNWPLGRITTLHPGKDGVIRVVSVKVRDKVLTRATNRVCALPIEQSNEDN